MSSVKTEAVAKPPRTYGAWLVFASLVGFTAAFTLTLERIQKLIEPESSVGCDFSVLVQCSANLTSWQGSVFGFPNPLLGLVGWSVLLTIGVLIAAGVTLPRWFLWSTLGGVTAAAGFIGWLIYQSIFVLGTLCPWCMVTWAVVLPTLFASWITLGASEALGLNPRLRSALSSLRHWIPLFGLGSLLLVALIAELRLSVTSYLF